MLQSGLNTEVEFLPAVEHLLITVSCWLVLPMLHGELKTLGEQVGVNQVLLELAKETPALSAAIPHIQLFD